MEQRQRMKLFWACFFALTATSFGFMLRAMLITEWSVEFSLSKTQMGQIMGVGLWPFAVSIVLFSLIIDKIGYGWSILIAFILHLASLLITLMADSYYTLYLGTFIFALGNGVVEATINPAVASMFPNEKSKWLNMLHAGWPAGMVAGGLIALTMGESVGWQLKIGIIIIPILAYGFLMLGKKFPVHERVSAGISYKDMLKEPGYIGAFIIITLIVLEIGNFFQWSLYFKGILIISTTLSFGLFVRSAGNPLFIILLLVMFPLATTELGTDSWIVDLMASEMRGLGIQAGWILLYTSVIMTIARFFAGPLLNKFNPTGLLSLSAGISAIGLFFMSRTTGILVFIAATIYGFAKAYLWPTMLGIVGERFPKGGALTLNVTTGVGMITVGIVGAVFLGYLQDVEIDKQLVYHDEINQTNLHADYMIKKESIFGDYYGLNPANIENAPETDNSIINDVQAKAKKASLKFVAILPLFLTLFYILLMLYFRNKGGYKSLQLKSSDG
jgi:fucose permease